MRTRNASLSQKTILIVTEVFDCGGLEEHIRSEVEWLTQNGYRTILALGERWSKEVRDLPIAHISLGLPLGPNAKVYEVLEAVIYLDRLIQRYNIDIIHAHPCCSIPVAALAASAAKRPLAVSLHGPNSLVNNYGSLFRTLLCEHIMPHSTVCVVSEELAAMVKSLSPATQPHLTFNPIQINNAPPQTQNASRGEWLLVGRLDDDKTGGMLDFISKARQAGIHRVTIAGDGSARRAFQRQVESLVDRPQLTWAGWVKDFRTRITDYSGVAGMGRIALEGMAAKKPVVIVGYDGVKGVVNGATVKNFSSTNFSGRTFPTVSAAELKQQIHSLSQSDLECLMAFVRDTYDQEVIWSNFASLVSQAIPFNSSTITAFLNSLSRDSRLLAHFFYSSPDVFKHLPHQSLFKSASSVHIGNSHFPEVAGTDVEPEKHLQAEKELDVPRSFTKAREAAPETPPAGPDAFSGSCTVQHDPTTKILAGHLTLVCRQARISFARARALTKSFRELWKRHGFSVALKPSTEYIFDLIRPGSRIAHNRTLSYERYEVLRAAFVDSLKRGLSGNLTLQEASIYGAIHNHLTHFEHKVVVLIGTCLDMGPTLQMVLQSHLPANAGLVIANSNIKSQYLLCHDEAIIETSSIAALSAVLAKDGRPFELVTTTPLGLPFVHYLRPKQVRYYLTQLVSIIGSSNYALVSDDRLLKQLATVVSLPDIPVNTAALFSQPSDQHAGVFSTNASNPRSTVYFGVLDESVDFRTLHEAIAGSHEVAIIGSPSFVPWCRQQSLLPPPWWEVLASLKNIDLRFCFSWLHLAEPLGFPSPLPKLVPESCKTLRQDIDILRAARKSWFFEDATSASILHSAIRKGVEPLDCSALQDEGGREMSSSILQWPALHRSPKGLRGTVYFLNMTYFDWNGERPFLGGAERYIRDLARLCRKEGLVPRVLQASNRPFSHQFEDLIIEGVPVDCGFDRAKVSIALARHCNDAALVIASPLELGLAVQGAPVIGINHGIDWDHVRFTEREFSISKFRHTIDAMRNCTAVVAVDTNFINWMRTVEYKLTDKVHYIPNYVDTRLFSWREPDFSGCLNVIYPRRLYEARGMYVVMDAFSILFDRGYNVRLRLVGQVDSPEENRALQAFLNRYPTMASWREKCFDEMVEEYTQCHVSLIPTVYSEGTSLSCLESLGCGLPVIATNVGGLPNLIIDGLNGRLIMPRCNELVLAVEECLQNREELYKWSRAARETAELHSKDRWEARWRSVIMEVCGL